MNDHVELRRSSPSAIDDVAVTYAVGSRQSANHELPHGDLHLIAGGADVPRAVECRARLRAVSNSSASDWRRLSRSIEGGSSMAVSGLRVLLFDQMKDREEQVPREFFESNRE